MLSENRKARFDYEILETFEAGLELEGWEVKSIKAGRVSSAGAKVIIRGNEAYLVGAVIQPYQPNNTKEGVEKQRTIRLLFHKKEIKYLEGKLSERGLTMIPIKLYNKGGKIKAELALAKGKKLHDKREKIKKREADREAERELKIQHR